MEEKRKYNYLILSIILSLLIIIVGGLTLLKPLFLEVTELNQQVANKTEEHKAQQQKLEDLKILEENYNKIKEEAKVVDIALPTEKKFEELISQIENIASITGLYFVSFIPTTSLTQDQATISQEKTNYKTISFNCTLSGTFSGLKKALKMIEENLRLIDVNSIQINKTGSPEENILSINLNCKTYWQPR